MTTVGGEKLYDAPPDPAAQAFYKNYQVIAEASEADRPQHLDAYEALLDAIAGANLLYKTRATEFIPQFVRSFPSLSEKSLSKLLDLAEDTEQAVRVRAIHALPLLSASAPEYTGKIADVLGQLLLVGTKLDQVAATDALNSVLEAHPAETLGALLAQVAQDELPADQEVDVPLRDRVLEYILASDAIISKTASALTEPAQEAIVTRVQRIVAACVNLSQASFQSLFGLVSRLPMFKGPAGQPKLTLLLELLEQQSGLFGASTPDVSNPQVFSKLKTCFTMAAPIARRQRNTFRPRAPKKAAPAAGGAGAEATEAPAAEGGAVEGTEVPAEAVEAPAAEAEAAPAFIAPPFKFLTAVADQVLSPASITKLSEVDLLELLKTYALSADLASDEEARALLPAFYAVLLHVLAPVATGADDAAKAKVNFSHTECVLHVFHALAKKATDLLATVCGLSLTPPPAPPKKAEFDGQPPRETVEPVAAAAAPAGPVVNEAEGAKFKPLLQALLAATKGVQAKVNEILKGAPEKAPQFQKVRDAQAVTRNVITLTDGLLKAPPKLFARGPGGPGPVHLSFQPQAAKPQQSGKPQGGPGASGGGKKPAGGAGGPAAGAVALNSKGRGVKRPNSPKAAAGGGASPKAQGGKQQQQQQKQKQQGGKGGKGAPTVVLAKKKTSVPSPAKKNKA